MKRPPRKFFVRLVRRPGDAPEYLGPTVTKLTGRVMEAVLLTESDAEDRAALVRRLLKSADVFGADAVVTVEPVRP